MTYASVVVKVNARALNRPFTYSVPPELEGLVHLGSIVEVSFGKRTLAGIVVELGGYREEYGEFAVKPLTRVLSEHPFWGQELLDLASFMRSYYGCTWLDSLSVAIPGPVLNRVQLAISRGSACQVVLPARRNRRDNVTAAQALYPGHELNSEQSAAVEAIAQARREGKTVLLFGITGSGKTEVYLRATQQVLAENKKAVVLVPEVSLTPQAIERYCGRLGECVGVLHSSLSDPERRDYWMAMRNGQLQVALGTRSAIFAPLDDLGLIIIDEEHEASYKQDRSPHYHARQIGYMRAKANKCGLVLGSATPSVESFYLARLGVYQLVELKQRASGQGLPPIRLVDMRRALGREHLLSFALAKAIEERLAKHEQVVLLLNRRGYSGFLQCRDCGHVPECPNCSIALTWHRSTNTLNCHYCNHREPRQLLCSECHGKRFSTGQGGTEKLAAELRERFPNVAISRLDRDTVGQHGSHQAILQEFGSQRTQILLGTQMVAKGLDYPNVTLVGVINADAGLHVPDFRAAERCFQQLEQVSGRAGRGEKSGEVILQTRNPDHPILQAVVKHDYLAMYEAQLADRREANYPPFCRLVKLGLTSEDAALVEREAVQAAEALEEELENCQVIGPAPCPLERIKRQYRWHMLIKAKTILPTVRAIRAYVDAHVSSAVAFSIDPDPQELT